MDLEKVRYPWKSIHSEFNVATEDGNVILTLTDKEEVVFKLKYGHLFELKLIQEAEYEKRL